MAVSKIRKISSWTLLLVCFLSIAVFAMFFFGGLDEPWKGSYKTPVYTAELLYWAYFLLGLCAVGLLIFGILQFGSKFLMSPKAALMTLSVLVGFAILLVIAYSLGSDVAITSHINSESQRYNVPFWLKITDMWLYAMYILLGLCACAMIWGSAKKILSK